MQRGAPNAVPEAGYSAHPLTLTAPVFLLRIAANEPWLLESPMGDDRDRPPQQRRLVPPGVYKVRITANVVVETELTEAQLRALFVRADVPGAVAQVVSAPLEPVDPEREARKERARQLLEAYREKLGEPPEALSPALVQWLQDWTEEELREAMDETAKEPRVSSRSARYEYMREVLRGWRRDRKPGGGK